ncbi:MAG: SMC family ATPase [Chloroflexota bacterium]
MRDARAELESEASGYTAQITELQRALEQADAEALSNVQAEVTELQTIEASRNGLQEQMATMNEDGASLRSLLKTLEDDGKKQGIRIDQLKATSSATCPLCGQPLDEHHRLELVGQLETELETMRATYREHQERSQIIKAETGGFRTQITEWDTELKRLQPLMKQVGELQAQMDRANEAETRLTEISAKLEAVQALLTGETFAQDIREQLTTLESERASIGYDRSSHDAARQKLDTYRAYETHQTQLAMALNSLPEVKETLQAAILRKERYQKALDEDSDTIEAVTTEIAKLAVLVKEQQARQQEVNRLRSFERTQYQRLVNARQELDALDKQRTRKGELEARQQARKHDQLVYDELRKAFGKNGVPAMIIEAAIPELEESANTLLSRMTDGRMNMHFSTQREKTSGEGVIETLDIEIADELGTRSYEMYSGGEAFRIDFAIRVALSQMLARRAGAHLRTLFIDEGFGTQDEDGRNKLVEAIIAIQDEFDLILVITHIEDLRDSFPVHILVEKTPNGSRISVR